MNAGGRGAEKYCEYPANLIRIVQRFLLGVELGLDGVVTLAPTATAEFQERGFGQRLAWRDRALDYRMRRGVVTGKYTGGAQRLVVRWGGKERVVDLRESEGGVKFRVG